MCKVNTTIGCINATVTNTTPLGDGETSANLQGFMPPHNFFENDWCGHEGAE